MIKDTRFIASRTALTTLQAAAAENSGSGIIQFDNCSFALSGSNPSTDAADSCLFAAVKNLTSGSMIFDNCIFSNGITRTFIYGLYLAGSSRAVLNNSFFAGANAANTITGSVTATVAGHEKDYFRDSTKSGVNDIYNAYKLTWTSGANNGESKYVNDYIGADREFRFADNFTNNIQVGDTYTIVSCTGGVVYLTGTANAILNNSRFLQSSTDTLYHVFVNSGCNAVVNNSLYTPTLVGGSGTIKEYLRPATFGRNLNVAATGEAAADAVKISSSSAAADNVEANIGNLDAAITSRLAVVDYEPPGEANPIVLLAAKMLINKAVQDKQTGEIKYYDDDGQTVVLTHTPEEGESQITRMPS